jgi:predicted ester cyclase
MNLDDMAKKLAATAPLGWPRDQKTWNDLKNAARPEIPIFKNLPITGFDVDRFLRITFENLWNKRDYDKLDLNFVENLQFEGPTNRKFNGLKDYQDFLKSLATCFPDLELQVDEIYWMGDEIDGFLSSTRWSASGTHKGSGVYGPPTGSQVQIWGITQNEIQKGRITKEWMLFNELDLMMQIAASN